mmetsp:Transcript_8265/g.12572  ORF Transcript_8265/g.12572 Transcript_8265/m.12572 type:complete len:215 (+) Transcript_8265:381-1025(+)
MTLQELFGCVKIGKTCDHLARLVFAQIDLTQVKARGIWMCLDFFDVADTQRELLNRLDDQLKFLKEHGTHLDWCTHCKVVKTWRKLSNGFCWSVQLAIDLLYCFWQVRLEKVIKHVHCIDTDSHDGCPLFVVITHLPRLLVGEPLVGLVDGVQYSCRCFVEVVFRHQLLSVCAQLVHVKRQRFKLIDKTRCIDHLAVTIFFGQVDGTMHKIAKS